MSAKTKERPILFSGPLVRAILRDVDPKTVTRRLVKPMPGEQAKWLSHELLNAVPHGEMIDGGWQMHHPKAGTIEDGVAVAHDSPLGWIRCPFGVAGDHLWVRETFYDDNGLRDTENKPTAPDKHIYYRADGEPQWEGDSGTPWTPSIHMPRWASRITLEILSVRVERLQDITEEDIVAEGVTVPLASSLTGVPWGDIPDLFTAWRLLWDHINGSRATWESNPWVWRIEFRRIKP